MSKKTGYLLGILLTIILGTILYWFFCCKPCLEANNSASEIVTETDDTSVEADLKTATMNAFTIKDANGSLDFKINDNLNFNTSGASILEPVSAKVDTTAMDVVKYFNDNPTKTLSITGHYRSEETNNSAFPNLGLARANATKNYYVAKGMSSKSINTYGQLDDAFYPDVNGVLNGPLMYDVVTTDAADHSAEDAIVKLGESIKANPLVLYFDTAQASISLTPAQRQKVADMVRYTDKIDGAQINTIGHTDNTGSRTANINLAQNRAEFAKDYLVNNGISANKISASSQGPDQPIADNNTAEGRAKNRRVVVTIN